MHHLFDASALVNLVLLKGRGAVSLTKGGRVLDLTSYETANAVRRLSQPTGRLSEDEACALVDSVQSLLDALDEIRHVEIDSRDTLKIALRESLTFYDAAHLYTARKKELALVTDDEMLAKKASRYVQTRRSKDL